MLGDEERRPGRGQRPERLADEPRPGRVELRGRLVEDDVARAASRGARRCPTSCAWPPDSRCGSRATRSLERRAGRSPRASARPSRRRSSPRFIGPSAISSNTVAAMPDRWVFGFWKPTTTAFGELVRRCGRPSASPSIVSVPVERRRRSTPAPGRTRRGRASTCPPRSARRARRSRRRRARGRCRGGPRARSPA